MSRLNEFPAVRHLPLAVMAAALAYPATPIAAQEAEAERHGCICPDEIRERVQAFTHGSRARLGVLLGEPEEVDGRTGVVLEQVPGGTPADRAGLRAGDIVVALDGEDLGDEPTRALLDAMTAVEPGDTVAVTFFRDGAERTAHVVTERAPGYAFFGDGPRFFTTPEIDPERFHFRTGEAGRLSPRVIVRNLLRDGLELVEVNPDLGRYFGTDRGVLVAEVEEDSRLGLRAGDVILDIDGREVRSPTHARSILASYLGDEEIRFRVVRDGATLEVTGRRGR